MKKEAGLQVKEEDGETKKYIQKIDFHDYTSTESVVVGGGKVIFVRNRSV